MAHTKVIKTYSQNTGVANTFSYSGSFDVFKGTEVVALLDGVALTYTASTINESASPREYTVDTSAKTIHIGGADLSSGSIEIRPVTDMGAPTPRADYAPGSSVAAADLNNNQLQLMRKAMEYDEQKLSSTGGTMTGDLTMGQAKSIIFEGASDDAYETTLTVTDPTADRTITLPNVTGTVVTTGDTGTVTATMLAANSVDSSELVDGSIDSSHISSNAVTTAKITADAVTGAKIADDAIDSEHYTDGSIDTAHIADGQITTAKLATDSVVTIKITDGNVTTAKIAGAAITTAKLGADCVTQDKIADDAVRTEHLADQAVTTALIADAAVNNSKLAADCISEDKIADDAVREEHLADNAVTTARIANDAINGDKIADDAVNSEHYVDGSIDTAHIADSQVTTAKIADANITTAKLATGAVTTAKITANAVVTDSINADAVTGAKIADDAIDSEHYTDASIDTAHIADGQVTAVKVASNAVTTAKITDANVTTAKIADDAITIAKVGCEQTTISDSDSHIPTSGAVVDYVAAQIAPIGGLEVIADEDNFPSTQPASGVVISIADAAGIVVSGSGSSTTARTAGNGSDNVTINNFPSSLYSETLASGNGLMVTSTGSSNVYNYHKLLASESDVKQLSDDINDFNSRYRIHAGEPSSNNDDGDMVWDTNANKMKVYDSTASAWKEVTSTGDFKFLVPVDAGTTTAATFDGSDTSFDLKEATNSGSAASVTNINQLMVVLNGVVQKPNAGSWSGSGEGFYLTDSDTIRFATAPPNGSTCFIVQSGSAVSIPTPGDGTVTTAKIASGAVTTAKLADANVTTAKLASDAVTGAKIADDAIDSEHITDNSIDTAHIADNQVTTAKIANGTITNDNISASAAIAGSKVNPDFGAGQALTCGSVDSNGGIIGASLQLDTSTVNYLYYTDSLQISKSGHGTEVTIDSAGYMGIGETTPLAQLHIKPATNITQLLLEQNNATDGYGLFQDGPNGGHLKFMRHINGTETQKLLLRHEGGLCFGTDSAEANALDDYEEGTFTPTTNDNFTGGSKSGFYVKIGQMVTCNMKLSWTGNGGQGGGVWIGALPFSTFNSSDMRCAVTIGYTFGYDTDGNKQLVGWMNNNNNAISIGYVNDNAALTATGANNASTAGEVHLSCTFRTN